MIRVFAALSLTLVAVLVAVPREAVGCGVAPHHGDRVDITDETALIVWDEATGTEHFIRRATFQSTGYDFGFLVPTPTRPDLGEADEAVFDRLAGITAPKVEYRHRKEKRSRGPAKMSAGAAPDAAAPPGGVEVLDQKQVGGYDAVVLKFRRGGGDDDPAVGAKELGDWLGRHGYEFGPTLVAWLKPYVANDWVMTAFRVGTPKPGVTSAAPLGLRAAPVRMSFKTDRPFYPYREPEEPRDDRARALPRLLRVFLIAATRFDGGLGDGTSPWAGRTVWADKLSTDQMNTVVPLAKLPAALPVGESWLTEFEDRSTPRPRTEEVYFTPSPDRSAVAKPTVIHDIIEYYDAPEPEEPEREWLTESNRLILVWVVIGVAVVALGARLLSGVVRRR